MFLQIWFLPLSFFFFASLRLSSLLHLSSSPSSSSCFLSPCLIHAHIHTKLNSVSWGWVYCLVCLFALPPLCSLLFSVCFVVLCTEAEMQIECRQFALGEDCVSTLGIYLTKKKTFIYLHMTRHIKLYLPLKHDVWGIFHQIFEAQYLRGNLLFPLYWCFQLTSIQNAFFSIIISSCIKYWWIINLAMFLTSTKQPKNLFSVWKPLLILCLPPPLLLVNNSTFSL